MVVLVCGGRAYWNRNKVFEVLDAIHAETPITKVVTGIAAGADTLGYMWAAANSIERPTYPANWDKYGKSAGHIRNQEMLDCEPVDLVVAFPGGRGTSDMIRRATKKGIKVRVVEDSNVDM